MIEKTLNIYCNESTQQMKKKFASKLDVVL